VVSLNQTELATEEDKAYQIDRWAKLFKATTWEEIKMIAQKDPALLDASETLYTLNSDETIRARCRAREDYERLHNTINRRLNELTTKNEELSAENKSLSAENEALKKLLLEHGIPTATDK
jgi:hypothetical protein